MSIMPKETKKDIPEVKAEPVERRELQVVREEEKALTAADRPKKPQNVFIGTLNVIAGPMRSVYDPIAKVCYEPLASHYDRKYRAKFPKHHSKVFSLDMALLTVIGALIVFAAFADTLLPLIPVAPIVRLDTLAPKSVTSGRETDYIIAFGNDSASKLGCAELRIHLPSDTVIDEPLPTFEDTGKTCWIDGARMGHLKADDAQHDVLVYLIGDMAPNAKDAVRFKATTFGPTGSTKVMTAELLYWEEAHTTPTRVASRSEWQVVDSTFSLDLDLPANINRGRQHGLTIRYGNAGTELIPEASVRLSAPDDFTVTGAEPSMTSRNEWRVGTLDPGAEGTITVYGFFRATPDAQRSAPTFAVRGYAAGAEGERVLAELVRENADPLAADVEFGHEIVTPAGRQALLPGEAVTVAVHYRNAGQKTLGDMRVTLDTEGKYLVSPSPEGLAWDSATNPELAAVKPGDAGTLTATFRIAGPITAEMLGAEEFPMLSIAARAQYATEDDPTRPIRVDTQVTDMPIATTLGLEGTALYFTKDGDQLGVGPLPPKVGQTTKYRVFLTVTTTTGGVDDAQLEAYLPPNVEWAGRATVTAGEALDHFPSTGRIRWLLGKIPAHAEGDADRIGASFEVAITPGEADVGSVPTLLKNIRVFGQDAVTGLRLNTVTETITTDLPYDRRAAGKGTVVK